MDELDSDARTSEPDDGYRMATSENSNTMDIDELAEELRMDDPELPPAEAEFIEAVEAAKSELDAGQIDRDEYRKRVARASSRYRRAADP